MTRPQRQTLILTLLFPDEAADGRAGSTVAARSLIGQGLLAPMLDGWKLTEQGAHVAHGLLVRGMETASFYETRALQNARLLRATFSGLRVGLRHASALRKASQRPRGLRGLGPRARPLGHVSARTDRRGARPPLRRGGAGLRSRGDRHVDLGPGAGVGHRKRRQPPILRIALCGLDGEHDMPKDWECVAWKARGGYGSQRQEGENVNRKRERIWFSPHCLREQRGQLALLGGAA